MTTLGFVAESLHGDDFLYGGDGNDDIRGGEGFAFSLRACDEFDEDIYWNYRINIAAY